MIIERPKCRPDAGAERQVPLWNIESMPVCEPIPVKLHVGADLRAGSEKFPVRFQIAGERIASRGADELSGDLNFLVVPRRVEAHVVNARIVDAHLSKCWPMRTAGSRLATGGSLRVAADVAVPILPLQRKSPRRGIGGITLYLRVQSGG